MRYNERGITLSGLRMSKQLFGFVDVDIHNDNNDIKVTSLFLRSVSLSFSLSPILSGPHAAHLYL
jgi:hypothetical protein